MILKEFNFFRKKARDEQEIVGEEDFEIINQASTPIKPESEGKVEEVQEVKEVKSNENLRKYSSSTKLDWSDNETIMSDLLEPPNPRHLSSPKKKINRNNHYTVSSSFKIPLSESNVERNEELESAKSLPSLRSSNSKSSLINRFLRNVTVKKMMDLKAAHKRRTSKRIMSLYVKGVKVNNVDDTLDKELIEEIHKGQEKQQQRYEDTLDKKMVIQFRKEIFRSRLERLKRVSYNIYTSHLDNAALVDNS